jgi:hypothetical protein
MSLLNVNVPVGTYRHYKGGMYSVIGYCKDGETGEVCVLYQPQDSVEIGEVVTYVHTVRDFVATMPALPHPIPRFQWINTSSY